MLLPRKTRTTTTVLQTTEWSPKYGSLVKASLVWAQIFFRIGTSMQVSLAGTRPDIGAVCAASNMHKEMLEDCCVNACEYRQRNVIGVMP